MALIFAPKSRLVTTGDPVYLVGTVLNDGADIMARAFP